MKEKKDISTGCIVSGALVAILIACAPVALIAFAHLMIYAPDGKVQFQIVSLFLIGLTVWFVSYLKKKKKRDSDDDRN